MAKCDPFEDSDFTYEKFEAAYNSDLANGLGNLISRVSTLAENSGLTFPVQKVPSIDIETEIYLKKFEINKAIEPIWGRIKELDQLINGKKVWALLKNDTDSSDKNSEELQKILDFLVKDIRQIAFDLKPFLPDTADKIEKQFNVEKIKKAKPLFPRLK